MPRVPNIHFFPLGSAGNVGPQVLRAGMVQAFVWPHPEIIHQEAVHEIHNGQNHQKLPEARKKARAPLTA